MYPSAQRHHGELVHGGNHHQWWPVIDLLVDYRHRNTGMTALAEFALGEIYKKPTDGFVDDHFAVAASGENGIIATQFSLCSGSFRISSPRRRCLEQATERRAAVANRHAREAGVCLLPRKPSNRLTEERTNKAIPRKKSMIAGLPIDATSTVNESWGSV